MAAHVMIDTQDTNDPELHHSRGRHRGVSGTGERRQGCDVVGSVLPNRSADSLGRACAGARIAFCVTGAGAGAGTATYASRIPALQDRLGLTPGEWRWSSCRSRAVPSWDSRSAAVSSPGAEAARACGWRSPATRPACWPSRTPRRSAGSWCSWQRRHQADRQARHRHEAQVERGRRPRPTTKSRDERSAEQAGALSGVQPGEDRTPTAAGELGPLSVESDVDDTVRGGPGAHG